MLSLSKHDGTVIPQGFAKRQLLLGSQKREAAMRLGLALGALLSLLIAGPAFAQAIPRAAPTSVVTIEKLPPPHIAGFRAPRRRRPPISAQVSGKARARSDAYFEGGYVLLLVDALYGVLVSGLLLWLRISAWMRNIAQSFTRSRFWQVADLCRAILRSWRLSRRFR